MRIAVVSLIGFAIVWTCTAVRCAAVEREGQQANSPHSRRNAILSRVSLPAGSAIDREGRRRFNRAKRKGAKIEETYDKVLLSPD
ncbi:MAG TPA: hypothetical protein VFI31_06230 [Pirellulales bacterium]|nr:hypothetical protein [Pirellulales bacterium]